jgi:hypothetical protein
MSKDMREQVMYAPIDGPEPVLAGTLCLMSAFLNGGCAHLAQKVIHNLTVLSKQPEFSDEFRRICLNLRAHWGNECARAYAAAQTEPQAESAIAQNNMPAGSTTLH